MAKFRSILLKMNESDFPSQEDLMKSLDFGSLDIGGERGGSNSNVGNSDDGLRSKSNTESPFLDTGQTDDPSICPYCNKTYRKPRVLDCLHSMCEDCIIAQLDGRNQKNLLCKFMDVELEQTVDARPTPPGVIRCPICSQETHIGNDPMFVNLMLLDYIRIRKYGVEMLDGGRICQACKSEEKALANCVHCRSDLCQKCVQAHYDMKMFDGHKIIMFTDKEMTEEPGKGGIGNGIEQMMMRMQMCNKHKSEFEHFCPSCDELLCTQCVTNEHLDHNCSPLNENLYNYQKKGMQNLAKQAEIKGKATVEARSAIPDREKMLNDSYVKCRDKIEEAFQSYMRIINEVKVDLLASLEKNRDDKQEFLNTLYQKIDKQTTLLQDALGYTNTLLAEGTNIDICQNHNKVLQQLKLLMHSMPDVNAEVDLDYEIPEDFPKKLESIIGGIKCRITGIPKDTKNLNNLPVLGTGNSTKLEGFSNEDDRVTMGGSAVLPGWDSPNLAPVSQAHQINPPHPQGPGTIGMERRMNRNSTNGNSYLSNDSGIYSSASDMTMSSPITQMMNTPNEAYNLPNAGRFGGIAESSFATSGGAGGFRTPTMMRNSFEANQYDVGNPLFQGDFLAATNAQPKAWNTNNLPQNMFGGNFDILRPRELMEPRYGMNEFSPLGHDPSTVAVAGGYRSRSSLCNTPSIETFPTQIPMAQPNYMGGGGGRSHFNHNTQQQLEMTITSMFSSDSTNAQDTFNTPQGLALGLDNEVAIADTNNHRCVVVDLKGNILRFIGSSGTEEGHVYYPKKIVAHIHNHTCRFIVLDRGTNQQFNRLQLFKNSGEYITRLSMPCQVDQVSVMAWNKENEQLIIIDNKNLVQSFQFETFNQLSLVRQFSISGNVHEPSDIGVFKGRYYITDYKMHCVVVYSLEGKLVHKFGALDITPYPVGIDFSKSGDILIGDSHGNHFHIVIFNSQGQPQHHYRCYQQKVSRCTGLKINSNGNIVTMSRQNSAIIVFNTLYLPPPA